MLTAYHSPSDMPFSPHSSGLSAPRLTLVHSCAEFSAKEIKNLSKTEYVWLRHTKHYTGGARGNYGDSTIDIHELAPGGELTLTIDQDEFLLAQNEQGVLFQKI